VAARKPFGLTDSSATEVTLTCESFAQLPERRVIARNATTINILCALIFINVLFTLNAKVRYFSEKSYLCLLIETEAEI
jgi:hypothetical protein